MKCQTLARYVSYSVSHAQVWLSHWRSHLALTLQKGCKPSLVGGQPDAEEEGPWLCSSPTRKHGPPCLPCASTPLLPAALHHADDDDDDDAEQEGGQSPSHGFQTGCCYQRRCDLLLLSCESGSPPYLKQMKFVSASQVVLPRASTKGKEGMESALCSKRL